MSRFMPVQRLRVLVKLSKQEDLERGLTNLPNDDFYARHILRTIKALNLPASQSRRLKFGRRYGR